MIYDTIIVLLDYNDLMKNITIVINNYLIITNIFKFMII